VLINEHRPGTIKSMTDRPNSVANRRSESDDTRQDEPGHL
jgi:hypothetical protein